jgi:DNA-binding transcriptional ArsR family regulator
MASTTLSRPAPGLAAPLTLAEASINVFEYMNTSPRSRTSTIEDVDFDALRRMLGALSDPTRQQIVALLSRERLNVTQLTERFSLSQPAISHHLRILSSAGLLVQERHGRERVYRVDTKCCRGLAEQFRNFMSQCCANAKCC